MACVMNSARATTRARISSSRGARVAAEIPPVSQPKPAQVSNKERSSLALGPSRRQLLLGAGVCTTVTGLELSGLLGSPAPAHAFTPPPPGLRLQKDRLDGYSFLYPEDWIPVTSTAADIFYRDISDVETNLFMEFSSPSSSSYKSVADLGTPEEAGKRALAQYLKEYMSSRIGVRRFAKVVSATSRIGPNGDLFYDIQVNLKSYADSNQFGILPEERIEQLEFNRRLITTLGVKNKSLYEMRLQTPESKVPGFEETITNIQQSLTLFNVDR